MTRESRDRSLRPQVGDESRGELPWFVAPVALALILIATFVVYVPAMGGGLVWDDEVNMTPLELQSLPGLYRIWFDPSATAQAQYYPLVHTAFWLEHNLWGESYLGYHLVNVLWHLLAIVLVYLIVVRLEIPGALLAAAIFALHPVMVESVGWMTEQKNTLSTVFYLSSLLAYIGFDRYGGRLRYLVSLMLFAAALLTKTATVILPVAILIISWWQRGTLSWRRDVRPLVPFFALSLASGLMTIWIERKLFASDPTDVELTLLARGLLAARALWFYVGKLLWPANLVLIYPRWAIDPGEWWQWLFPTAAAMVLVGLWAIRRTARGPLAGTLLFCSTLLPVIGLVNVYIFSFTFVADHFQYLASLGLIVPVAAGVAIGVTRLAGSPRYMAVAVCLFLLVTLGVMSWQQSHLFGNVIALYEKTLDANPNAWIVHNNIAVELAERGNREKAMEHYETALALKPKSAIVHLNHASLLMRSGQQLDAVNELKTALALKPDLTPARNKLVTLLMQLNRPDDAIEQFHLILQLNPNDANAHNNLAMIFAQQGKFEEAIAQIQEAIRLDPDRAALHANIAFIMRTAGRPNEAIEHYRTAIKLQPDSFDSHFRLAQTLAAIHRDAEAVANAQRALDLALAAGNQAAANEIDEWLGHYKKELERAAETESK